MTPVHPAPGSAVAPRSVPRVVAMCDERSSASPVSDSTATRVSPAFNGARITDLPLPQDSNSLEGFQDYVDPRTRVRAIVPVCVDAATGEATLTRPVPPGFVPAVGAANEDTTSGHNIKQRAGTAIRHLLGPSPELAPLNSSRLRTPQRVALSPVRQLDFDASTAAPAGTGCMAKMYCTDSD